MSNPYQAPEANELGVDARSGPEAKRRYVIIALAISAVAMGAGEAYFETNNELYAAWNVITSILIMVLILMWTHYDAQVRKFSLGAGIRIAIVLLAFVALPYYLFKSRGFRNGMIAMGLLVFSFVAMVVLFAAGYLPANLIMTGDTGF